MRYSILCEGIPVAMFAADSAAIGCVVVQTLAGMDRIRGVLPSWWADPNGFSTPGCVPSSIDAVQLASRLELRDERGILVPTSRIELCTTGPTTALAVIRLDDAPANVPAVARGIQPISGEAAS